MNVTATLIGQMITFAILIWFVNRFLWKPVTAMMTDRSKRIADGLAAAERSQRELELAQQRATDLLKEAKQQATEIISRAEKRANEIVEEGKAEARVETERLLATARAEVQQEINRAKEQLRDQVAVLAVVGAGRILEREIDQQAHNELLDKLVANL